MPRLRVFVESDDDEFGKEVMQIIMDALATHFGQKRMIDINTVVNFELLCEGCSTVLTGDQIRYCKHCTRTNKTFYAREYRAQKKGKAREK